MKGGRSSYCTSCYTGVYPVAFPRDEAAYLQLALKLNGEPANAGERTADSGERPAQSGERIADPVKP